MKFISLIFMTELDANVMLGYLYINSQFSQSEPVDLGGGNNRFVELH